MSTLQQDIHNQIKLRFWDTKEQRWCGREISGWVLIDDKNNSQQGIIIAPKYKHIVTMRFTGLLDRHGKEIYEGDIVKADGVERIIEFRDGAFTCANSFPSHTIPTGWIDIKIIGNIYEDSHLLKRKKLPIRKIR